ncbi:hypothetical protein BDA96_07G238900 [Sorghum bicolor]|uniref:Uncharacterized protein n=1 Tax=Sorghum bicolor TaxID=4558 RepID=A0A921UAS0_SORBI|nr:hypothetical protein BDA96_07G238900 [Sorghum bicolor]
MARWSALEGEKVTCGTPSSLASGCVHPVKKSEMTAVTRWPCRPCSLHQARSGARSAARETMKGRKRWRGRSLVFSPLPGGSSGEDGKGSESTATDEHARTSGDSSAALPDVTATVTARPRVASSAARSRSGSMWPCAGYGTRSTCGPPPPPPPSLGRSCAGCVCVPMDKNKWMDLNRWGYN